MEQTLAAERKPVTAPALAQMKARGERVVAVTAYDFPTARLADQAGVDVILVGDSLGMVVLGHETPVPVTLEDMLHHARAVARARTRALVVADLPFLTYQLGPEQALANAGCSGVPTMHNLPLGEAATALNPGRIAQVVDLIGLDYYHPANPRHHVTIMRRTSELAARCDGRGTPPFALLVRTQ